MNVQQVYAGPDRRVLVPGALTALKSEETSLLSVGYRGKAADSSEANQLNGNSKHAKAIDSVLDSDDDTLSLISQSGTSEGDTQASNQLTPASKILCLSDLDPERTRRSFTRFKQTGELVNTERVYLASLEILKQDYIDTFTSDVSCPIFFDTFKDCICNLIASHTLLYQKLNTLYLDWASKCLNTKGGDLLAQLKSPSFGAFSYISQPIEHKFICEVVSLLEKDAINVTLYGQYCSLFNRVVSFAVNNGIEKYKRNSINISSDYIVSYRKLESDTLFVDQRLDTRFISVVQMPTNRITRYKLMIGSLLKNIHLDEPVHIVNQFKQSEDKLGELVDNVNHYVGEANRQFERLDDFKKIFLNNNINTKLKKSPLNSLFFDNLSFINFTGAVALVYYDEVHNGIISYNAITAIFDSHIIFGKPSKLYPNRAEILLALPMISIINCNEIINKYGNSNGYYTLATQYESSFNITFEDNFKIFEISLVFVDNSELNIWKESIANTLKKSYNLNKFIDQWGFSSFQQRINQINLGKEIDYFNVSGYTPPNLSAIKSINHEDHQVHLFDVDISVNKREEALFSPSPVQRRHSRQHLKGRDSPGSSLPAQNRVKLIKMTLHDRVLCQMCLGQLWNPSLDKYEFELSLQTSSTFGSFRRSVSTFFKSEDEFLLRSRRSSANIHSDHIDNSQGLLPAFKADQGTLRTSNSTSSLRYSFLNSVLPQTPQKATLQQQPPDKIVTPRTPSTISTRYTVSEPKTPMHIKRSGGSGVLNSVLYTSPQSRQQPKKKIKHHQRVHCINFSGSDSFPQEEIQSSAMSLKTSASKSSNRSSVSNFFRGWIHKNS